jgi:hypothetical protein
MKSLLKKSALLVAVASMALASQAYALSISLTDTRYLGFFDPGTPANATTEAANITTLLSLPTDPVLDDVDATIGGNTYGRTPVSTVGLPAATGVGGLQGLAPSGSVIVTGFQYVLAKYGTTAHVWYVGGLGGSVDLPLVEPGGAFGTQGQSHYSLYNPGTSVPDGGATVALLGLGLAALALARRKI